MSAFESSAESAQIDVGRRLREYRTAYGLSLRALAEQSGLNFNTLSLIENGKTSPSVSTLQQLAAALRVPVAAFFSTDEPSARVVFQKADQRPRAQFSGGAFEDLGAGLSAADARPLLVTMESRTDSGADAIVHTGLELVYCLTGQLDYKIEQGTYHLETGDSLFFEAHLPHWWGNPGDVPAVSLLVFFPADRNDEPLERHFSAGPGDERFPGGQMWGQWRHGRRCTDGRPSPRGGRGFGGRGRGMGNED